MLKDADERSWRKRKRLKLLSAFPLFAIGVLTRRRVDHVTDTCQQLMKPRDECECDKLELPKLHIASSPATQPKIGSLYDRSSTGN